MCALKPARLLNCNFSLAVLIISYCVLYLPTVLRAEISGDRKDLILVADRYAANLAKLKTWRGEVRYSKTSLEPEKGEGAVRQIECRIQFAIDVAGDKSRLNVERTSDVVVLKDGKVVDSLKKLTESYIKRDNLYYDLHYLPESKGRQANVRTEPLRKKPGDSTLTFAPLYFFTIRGADLTERWKFFDKEADNPKLEGTGEITRAGDVVTLKIVAGGDHTPGWFSTAADLGKGGNPVRYINETRLAQSTNLTTCQWEWQEIAGVFVPSKYQRDSITEGSKRDEEHVTVVWTESVVNEPLSDDEFGFAKLGLRQGDQVVDGQGKRMVINDESFPKAAPRVPVAAVQPAPSSMLKTIAIVGNIIIILLIITWIMLRRKRSRT